jgi:hypothetical protein
MSHKTRLDRVEKVLNPEPGERVVLVDACEPPHWMIGGKPETMQQGEPELRPSDYVVNCGNICLRAF